MKCKNLKWIKKNVSQELIRLLSVLGEEYPIREGGEGIELVFKKVKEGLAVKKEHSRAIISYGNLSDAARAIGILLAENSNSFEVVERAPFKTFGILLECSRNKVPTVKHLKKWLIRMSLFGYNLLMLYTKDTYTLPGEDYFGYLRGRYTLDELREIDEYASRLGVEMVGSIQALGHLEPVLRWPAYYKIRDTSSVLLTTEEDSYKLTEKMLDFYSKAFRSRRIHLGMDETHDLGRGRYMDLNGYRRGFDIFNDHLERVVKQCETHRLRPMIWSDMYFRMGSKTQGYYDRDSVIPKDVAQRIPQDAQLVYWDYYHKEKEFYVEWLRRHKKLGSLPVMASGIWTWRRFWYDHEMTVATAVPCMDACVSENVEDFIFTMWGDDGAYCDFDSAMAGVCYMAEKAYTGNEPDDNTLQKRFKAVCKGNYMAHITASSLSRDEYMAPAFLWDDPLLGIYWKNQKQQNPDYWKEVLDKHADVKSKLVNISNGDCGDIRHLLKIHEYLKNKIVLKSALDEICASSDTMVIEQAKKLVKPCLSSLEELKESFRKLWYARHKTYGFEVIQIRLAGQGARLSELETRLGELVSGKIKSIPELEEHAESQPVIYKYASLATGSYFI